MTHCDSPLVVFVLSLTLYHEFLFESSFLCHFILQLATDEELYYDYYNNCHYSEKSDICGSEICEISAFDMGVAAAYLLVGYKACHGGDKSAKTAYVRSYYKCVQLVGEA